MPFYHTAQFSYKMSTVKNGHNIPLVCICKLTKKKQVSHKKNVFLTHKMLLKHIGHKTIKIIEIERNNRIMSLTLQKQLQGGGNKRLIYRLCSSTNVSNVRKELRTNITF